MKVLVTGAAGFIGRHVSKLLETEGHDVIRLDSICPPDVFIDYQSDITKPLGPIPDLDAVIHLAAMANPRECDVDPGKAFDVNVNGTHQVLKMALESGAKKVVFSSTAHVYDIPPTYMPTDEVHPLRLNNTYTTTKILGEQLCELYWENHGLSYTTLRLFNAYGPGQQAGYFIPDQIEKAKGGAINLQGSGTTKDWVWVGDVANAFIQAITSDFVGPVNVGTGTETSLGTIAKIIAKTYKVKLDAYSIGLPTRMCADWHRAKNVLGWSPTVSVLDGLDRIMGAVSRMA